MVIKPRANYQELLKEEVSARLAADVGLTLAAVAIMEAPVQQMRADRSLTDILVPAPVRDKHVGYKRRKSPTVIRRGIDYLALEARNSALGLEGEKFALDVEHQRLWEADRRDLANRIEHVSQTQGDDLGYDILSFEDNGREKLIEVKTTAFGAMTPFYASARGLLLQARLRSASVFTAFSTSENFHRCLFSRVHCPAHACLIPYNIEYHCFE